MHTNTFIYDQLRPGLLEYMKSEKNYTDVANLWVIANNTAAKQSRNTFDLIDDCKYEIRNELREMEADFLHLHCLKLRKEELKEDIPDAEIKELENIIVPKRKELEEAKAALEVVAVKERFLFLSGQVWWYNGIDDFDKPKVKRDIELIAKYEDLIKEYEKKLDELKKAHTTFENAKKAIDELKKSGMLDGIPVSDSP